MNKTQRRQFDDELYFLLKKILKSSFFQRIWDGSLGDDKRKAVHYALVSLLTKYGCCPSDVYSQFDKMWDNICKEYDKEHEKVHEEYAYCSAHLQLAKSLEIESPMSRYKRSINEYMNKFADKSMD